MDLRAKIEKYGVFTAVIFDKSDMYNSFVEIEKRTFEDAVICGVLAECKESPGFLTESWVSGLSEIFYTRPGSRYFVSAECELAPGLLRTLQVSVKLNSSYTFAVMQELSKYCNLKYTPILKLHDFIQDYELDESQSFNDLVDWVVAHLLDEYRTVHYSEIINRSIKSAIEKLD